MKSMRTAWALRIVAILLLGLSCGCLAADCHGSGCMDECDCSGNCTHVCRCALINDCSPEITVTVASIAGDDGIRIPQASCNGIFRPPVSNASILNS